MQSQRTLRNTMVLVIATLLLFIAAALGLLLGATTYSPKEIFSNPSVATIVWELRLPRVLLAFIVGGGLAVVGACYQALFRNTLASPFSLGVSSGAALGAALSMVVGMPAWLGGSDSGASAIVGALISIGVIASLSRREGSGDRLLLVGVVFSFLCSSALTLLQYLADYSQLFKVTRWLMGGVPATSLQDVMIGAACVLLLLGWVMAKHRELDLILFGEDIARTKGVDVERLRRVSFVVTSVFVGWVVSQCGVIGFVGIIVPAVARLVTGIAHVRLVPLSFILGALLVTACDLLGRVTIPPFEVPAGVFTALMGGPAFILLLLNSKLRGRVIG